jgi:hypothetical protein
MSQQLGPLVLFLNELDASAFGWTRTSNQTVVSDPPPAEMPEESDDCVAFDNV